MKLEEAMGLKATYSEQAPDKSHEEDSVTC